jgi:aldehyde:ferredoxin oxidoreductase
MHFGFVGKILDVNLSPKRIMGEKLDVRVARKFLGGLGLGLKVLYDEVGPNVDPLDPENPIIIATGRLTGSAAPTSGRTEILTKSPLTGGIGRGNFGGWWGVRLKRAGFDAVIVRGKSNKPVYLWIEDELVELRSAEHLWGEDSWETTDVLKRELGEDISVLSIGQAGENLVRFACPVVDYHHAPGRSHAGCVMGGKKLKAIAVRGTKGVVAVAEPEQFKAAVREITERIAAYPERGDRTRIGSNYLVQGAAESGMVPGTRNFQTTVLPRDSEVWNLPKSAEDCLTMGPEYGHHCPLAEYYGCNLMANIKTGEYAGMKVGGVCFSLPGWEWGAKCGIRSYPAIWKCRELCNRYGMDQSGPIPFALELFQRGIITRENTDGLDLEWGNELAIMDMLCKIAHREGLGNILAEGSARAALRIGMGAEKCALTVKGMEIQYLDARIAPPAMNLGTVVGPRGDDLNTTHGIYETFPEWAKRAGWSKDEYLRWFVDWIDMSQDVKEKIFGTPPRPDALDAHTVEGKAAYIKWYGEVSSIYNSLGLCLFTTNCFSAMGPAHFARLYSACTGWHITPSGIMKAGERIFNLMKAYIVREGFTRKDDDWPARFYEEPLPEGPARGAVLSKDDVNRLLDEYYELMGWDKRSGMPTKGNLAELGLEEVADELEGLGKLMNTSK